MNAHDLLRDALVKEHHKQRELITPAERIDLIHWHAEQLDDLGNAFDSIHRGRALRPSQVHALSAAVFALAGVDP